MIDIYLCHNCLGAPKFDKLFTKYTGAVKLLAVRCEECNTEFGQPCRKKTKEEQNDGSKPLQEN